MNPGFRDRLMLATLRMSPLWGTGTIVGYLHFWKKKVFYPAERLLAYNNHVNNTNVALLESVKFSASEAQNAHYSFHRSGVGTFNEWNGKSTSSFASETVSPYRVSECENKLFFVPLTQFWHTSLPPSPTSFTWKKFGGKISTSVSVIWLCRCICDRPVMS